MQKVTFKGNIFQLVKQTYLYFFPIGLLLSFIIAGRYCFFDFFIFTLVLSLPGAFLFCIIALPLDWFSLDDQGKKITKALRWSISYQKVKAIYITESLGLLSVTIKKGWLQRIWLAMALDAKEKQRLIEELAKRFPKEILHQRRFSDRKIIIGVTLGLLLIHSIFLFHLYREYPQLRITPQRKIWGITQDLLTKEQRRYTFGGITFSLPLDFNLVKEEKQKLLFENEDKKIKIMVIPGLYKNIEALPQSKSLLSYGLGIKDSYDLFQTVYSARFGMIPLILKGVTLEDLNKIKIYKIGQISFKGFILQGIKNEREFVDILLVDKKKKSEINFTISSSEKIDEETLRIIVGSIRIRNRKE